MSSIYALIKHEEGWRSKPYLCTEKYPTVGFGFRIGPQGADIKLYQFTLPVRAGEAWLDTILSGLETDMRRDPKLAMAMQACERDPARMAVLQSMAYQMGVQGLAAFKNTLQAVIEMRYQRVTLVAREGGERMTIDGNLWFSIGERSRTTRPDVFIVETKSANGNGIADKILRALHQHPTSRCSKYCVGMAALEAVERHNKFLPALRKLEVVPERRPTPVMMAARGAHAMDSALTAPSFH